MWLGIAAGLALLTLPFARLAHAQNVTADDQQLLYDGQGWKTFVAPQECTEISQTYHETSNSGDTVSYSFTGNAVFVYGPSDPGSPPITVVLDNTIQSLAPVTQDSSGCGVLYSNPNIPNNGQQHRLVMMYTNPTDSGFGISGIMTSLSNNSPPPQIQAASLTPPSTLSSSTTSSSTTSSSTTSVTPTTASVAPTSTADSGTAPNAVGGDPTANGTATASGADASSSVIDTSEFVTTPGMTVGVIGAIVGTVLGMITLLILFLLIRRRITRKDALKKNQQTIFKSNREREMEEGKRKMPFVDDALSPVWQSKDADAPYAGMQSAGGSVIDVSGPAMPAAVASIASPTSIHSRSGRAPSTTFTVNLPRSFLNEPPPPRTSHPSSPTPQGVDTRGSSEMSQGSAPPPFSAASAATWGTDRDAKTQGAHVVNRVDSNRSASTARTVPPPGYF